MQKSKVVTIQRHIVEQERLFPKATGDFTGLLWDLTLAAKTISREVNKAGLAEILGLTGEVNIHGEAVKKQSFDLVLLKFKFFQRWMDRYSISFQSNLIAAQQ